jgi:hypothetical protein
MKRKDLPTLSDSDIVTNDDIKKTSKPSFGLKKSTIALALALTTVTGTTLTSCSDGTDCDSDVSRSADPAADGYDNGAYDSSDPYDYGQYDTSDSDISKSADAKPCD